MSDKHSPRTEGRWAGAAFGTGYLGVITLIPDSLSSLREFLVYVAPTVAILTAWGWAYCRARFMRKVIDDELTSAITRATQVRDDILADENSTDDMKANAVQAVNDLKALRVTAVTDHYHRVKADLANMG